MTYSDIRSSSSISTFYDDIENLNWKVEKTRKSFAWIMKEYFTIYKTVETTMRDVDVLEKSLTFHAIKTRLHTILSNINTRFEQNSSDISAAWRIKILSKIIHKINNNAIKYKRKRREFNEDVQSNSKQKKFESESTSNRREFTRETITQDLISCIVFEDKIMLAQQSFNKELIVFFCDTIELMSQKKSLEKIIVENLDFDKWKSILQEDDVITRIYDKIMYISSDDSLKIRNDRNLRATLNEMHFRDMTRFTFTMMSSTQSESRRACSISLRRDC